MGVKLLANVGADSCIFTHQAVREQRQHQFGAPLYFLSFATCKSNVNSHSVFRYEVLRNTPESLTVLLCSPWNVPRFCFFLVFFLITAFSLFDCYLLQNQNYIPISKCLPYWVSWIAFELHWSELWSTLSPIWKQHPWRNTKINLSHLASALWLFFFFFLPCTWYILFSYLFVREHWELNLIP